MNASAMREEPNSVSGTVEGNDIVLRVIDDGIGMSGETLANMMNKESDTGLGIAVKNVRDRIRGYFGPESSMTVESELGCGTTVTFRLDRAIAEGAEDAYLENEDLRESAIPDIPKPVVE